MTKFVHLSENIEVACPFCGDNGFDLIGLKHHLDAGWCDAYNAIDISQLHTML